MHSALSAINKLQDPNFIIEFRVRAETVPDTDEDGNVRQLKILHAKEVGMVQQVGASNQGQLYVRQTSFDVGGRELWDFGTDVAVDFAGVAWVATYVDDGTYPLAVFDEEAMQLWTVEGLERIVVSDRGVAITEEYEPASDTTKVRLAPARVVTRPNRTRWSSRSCYPCLHSRDARVKSDALGHDPVPGFSGIALSGVGARRLSARAVRFTDRPLPEDAARAVGLTTTHSVISAGESLQAWGLGAWPGFDAALADTPVGHRLAPRRSGGANRDQVALDVRDLDLGLVDRGAVEELPWRGSASSGSVSQHYAGT
ncbi:MAG: hypothetical protein AB8H79_00345, partial [Myxococcota bacterium]